MLRPLQPGSKEIWVNRSVNSGTTQLAVTKGGWVRLQQVDDLDSSSRVPVVFHLTIAEFTAMTKAFEELLE